MPAELSAALVDLRRTEGVVPLRLTGLSSAEIGRAGRAGGGRRPRPRPADPRGRHPRPHPGQRVPGDRALAGARRDRRAGRRRRPRPADAHPGGARQPRRRARGGEPAPGPARRRRPPACSSWPRWSAPEFDLTVLGGGVGDRRGGAPRARSTWRCEAAWWPPCPSARWCYCFAHELVRRALYDRLTAPRRAELHLRAGEAIEAATPAAVGAHAGRPGPPLHRRGAARRDRARGRLQRARGRRRDRGARVRRGGGGAAHGARAGRPRRAPTGPRSSSRSASPAIAAATARTRSSRTARRPTSPATSATASCSRGRPSGSRTPAGAWPPSRPGRSSS